MGASEDQQAVYEALRACKLWRAASDDAVRRLSSAARLRRFAQGSLIAEEGQAAVSFAVVASGTATVYHLGADGRRIAFETAGPGEPLLAVAALAGGRYPAHVEATSDLTAAWLDRDALFSLMAEEPAVARDIVTQLAGRVVAFTGLVESLSLDVPARLARYLFQRALAGGRQVAGGLELDLDMPKGDLAEALGTVPETLSRAFATLKREGIAETRGSRVIVHDVGALARRGAGYSEG
jgi:CRP/FNR family transcriptional regulator, dissimilatory nitrate respiration regulator